MGSESIWSAVSVKRCSPLPGTSCSTLRMLTLSISTNWARKTVHQPHQRLMSRDEENLCQCVNQVVIVSWYFNPTIQSVFSSLLDQNTIVSVISREPRDLISSFKNWKNKYLSNWLLFLLLPSKCGWLVISVEAFRASTQHTQYVFRAQPLPGANTLQLTIMIILNNDADQKTIRAGVMGDEEAGLHWSQSCPDDEADAM